MCPTANRKLHLHLPWTTQWRSWVSPAKFDVLFVAPSYGAPSRHCAHVVERKLAPRQWCTVSLDTLYGSEFKPLAMPTYLLLVRMKLARSEHICIHIALCTLTKVLVLLEDLSVEVANVGKLFIWSILMAVDFIFDLARRGRSWHHALNVEKVITSKMSAAFHRNDLLRGLTCKSPMWLDSRRLLLV